MAKKKKKKKKNQIKREIKRLDNGNIQINYTIPFEIVEKERKQVAKELGKDVEIPGFRKGKAPLKKIIEHIPDNTLVEQTLGKILPDVVGETIEEEGIKPAIYPKFELVSAKEGEDWEVMAITCELPEVELGDYKKELAGASKASSIWTPDKGSEEKEKREPSKEEQEQLALQTLKDSVDAKIPQILIEEEANSRLSNLLDRIEKLGLSLDQYLSSSGKTAPEMRKEYEKQAQEAILVDLALQKVADKEGIKIDKKEIDETIKASSADPELSKRLDTPEQRRMIEAVLKKRAALEKLTSYFKQA